MGFYCTSCCSTSKTSQEHGSVLLYLVIVLVTFGIFAMAGSNLFSSSIRGISESNCALKARYMSEAGIRFATAKLRACANEADILAAVTAINSHGPYAVDAANGLSFTVSATYVSGTATVSAVGTSCTGATAAASSSASSALNLPAGSTPSPPPASQASSSPSLKGLYASSSSSWMSGSTTANVTTTSRKISGGSVVGGSYIYLGTGSACLDIGGGVVIGTVGGNNYVCSNSCVTIGGGARINGDVYAQGDVTVSSQVNGDIHSGGDVYLDWGATVNGDIHVNGQVHMPNYYNGFHGNVSTSSATPALCPTYTLPAHVTVPSTAPLAVTGNYTFLGSLDPEAKTYAFTSISSTGGSKICFDLSTPNTTINIYNSGSMTINGDVYVRTSTATSCFAAANRVSNVNFANHAAASRVYADVAGTVSFAGGSNWFGTVYAGGNIYPGGGGSYIGAFYTNQNFNPNQTWMYSRFVLSDYVLNYWP